MFSPSERYAPPARALIYVVLAVWALFALFPLYWVVSTAFKPSGETLAFPPRLVPRHPTLANFVELATNSAFGLRPFLNTLVIAGGSTALCLLLSSMAGYGFSRYRFPLRRAVISFLILLRLLPGIVMMIPLYRLYLLYGLYDTFTGLILIHGVGAATFCSWFLLGYFDSIPHDIEEAALIDGCGRMGALARIMLPLAAPALGAISIFTFLGAWNDFSTAVVLTARQSIQPYTVILNKMMMDNGIVRWGMLSAAAFLAVAPVFILFAFFQKSFVFGLSQGAVKG